MRDLRFAGYLALLCFSALTCATPIAPEGGPRDTTPPQLDTLRSTRNEQTNFVKQPIELAFDEWVQLDDVANQVLVSPPLEYRPQIRIRRRSVLFEFDSREQLRPNVTYAINFGTAIKDLTERNPADNIRFVFSTGPELDSLTLEGKIRDALTGEPVEKALFMLYDNLTDSVVRKERPLYFGKTDKEGRFEIKNIREGIFKGFALAEINNNYRYDVANEKIGFPDTLIALGAEAQPPVDLFLFTEPSPLRRLGIDSSSAGLLKVLLNRAPEGIFAQTENSSDTLWQAVSKDTLLLWSLPTTGGRIFLQQDSTFADTLLIPAPTPAKAFPPLLPEPKPSETFFRQHPAEHFILRSSTPWRMVDATAIALLEDTLLNPVQAEIFLDSTDARLLQIRYPWKESQSYRLEIPPQAVQDIFGQSPDTMLTYQLEVAPRKNYGNILLTVSGLDSAYAHVLELLTSGGAPTLKRILPAGTSQQRLEFYTLFPQAYSVRIVEDRNNNGFWDSGSYESRRQPERIFTFKLEALRANWDLEAEVKIAQ